MVVLVELACLERVSKLRKVPRNEFESKEEDAPANLNMLHQSGERQKCFLCVLCVLCVLRG
jgi:hypothetical protein